MIEIATLVRCAHQAGTRTDLAAIAEPTPGDELHHVQPGRIVTDAAQLEEIASWWARLTGSRFACLPFGIVMMIGGISRAFSISESGRYMMTISTRFVVPGFVLLFALALAAPVAAQKPSASGSETPVFFRTGYQVPAGKRLLIEDVSVVCAAVGALPFQEGYLTSGDFEKYGISGTATLSIFYAPANCPEEPDSEDGCPAQQHVVGTARTNGTNPIAVTGEGRPVAGIGAGRRIAAFAEQGGILNAFCSGLFADFPSAELTGTARLVDR
jgi:hypothetical protein